MHLSKRRSCKSRFVEPTLSVTCRHPRHTACRPTMSHDEITTDTADNDKPCCEALMNEWMNEWINESDLKCVRKPTKSRLIQTNRANKSPLSRVKSLDGPRVRVISPVGKEQIYGGKDLGLWRKGFYRTQNHVVKRKVVP